MGAAYQIHDQQDVYFMTFQVVYWMDVFTRQCYRDIVLESMTYCRNNKGLLVYGYVIMSNHVHAIVASQTGELSSTIRDFKKFTASRILEAVQEEGESRRRWLLRQMEHAARKHKRNSIHQLWTHENHAVQLKSLQLAEQRLHYIHQNPVRAGIVANAEHYVYSSAALYAGEEGLIEIDFMK